MASFIEKAVNPAFYKQKISTWSHASAEYYKPLFRSGRCVNLWRPWIVLFRLVAACGGQ